MVTVVACVCVSSLNFPYSNDCLSAAIDSFKTCFFCKTASSQSYRIRVEATSAPVSHFACLGWRTSVYVFIITIIVIIIYYIILCIIVFYCSIVIAIMIIIPPFSVQLFDFILYLNYYVLVSRWRAVLGTCKHTRSYLLSNGKQKVSWDPSLVSKERA